ncbi:MAG TPA: restriction endonuclease [Pirellulales bacterium]|jgi:hypothetical protein|nr:restriction endonuclease [Pirellulales bacterium]
MSTAHFPDNVMSVMKDAIINVFWKKTDVRALFDRCGVPRDLVSGQDWTAYKIHIVSPVLDNLNSTPKGLGPLRQILQETLKYTDGKHLLWLPDGEKRRKEAERGLEHLRLLVKELDAAKRTEDEERQARLRQLEQAKGGIAFRNKLDQIKTRFYALFQNPDAQARGYGLEDILYDTFDLFELSPRGPFRRIGEQIDGAFAHAGDHFLLEAKWQKEPVNLADLRDLDGAVSSSLDNTLGLFVSLNGFSGEALTGYSTGNRPRIICMDGMHLVSVVEGRIDLSDLIARIRDVAVQKKRIFVPVDEILAGKV